VADTQTGTRPKPTVSREESKGGISPVVWIMIIIVVAVAAYFLGQAKG